MMNVFDSQQVEGGAGSNQPQPRVLPQPVDTARRQPAVNKAGLRSLLLGFDIDLTAALFCALVYDFCTPCSHQLCLITADLYDFVQTEMLAVVMQVFTSAVVHNVPTLVHRLIIDGRKRTEWPRND